MKIRIIGPSGSGKSYFARKLSEKLSIPCYDLDDIFWDNSAVSFSVKRDARQRDAVFREAVARDDWIIEGVMHSWTAESFSGADVIYLLEPPPLLCRTRIVRRFFKRKLLGKGRKNESLRSLVELLRWTEKFYAVNLPEIRAELEPYSGKVVRITRKKEIKRILK